MRANATLQLSVTIMLYITRKFKRFIFHNQPRNHPTRVAMLLLLLFFKCITNHAKARATKAPILVTSSFL